MPRTIRSTDLFDLRSVGAVSVNGQRVAYTIAWPDQETDETRSTIHLYEGDEARPLTDGHRDTAPVFAPDGSRLAFIRTDPDGKPQAAIVSIETGRVEIVPGYEHEKVQQVDWVDADRLLIRVTRRPDEHIGLDDDEIKRRPLVTRRLDYRFNGRGTTLNARRQVDIVELADRSRRRMTSVGIDHEAAAVSPDGSQVLVIAVTDDDGDIRGTTRVWLLSTGDEEPVLLTPEPGRWVSVGFTSDGRPWAGGESNPTQPGFSRPHLLFADAPPQVFGPHDVNSSAAIGGSAGARVQPGAIYMAGIRGTTISVDRYDDQTGDLSTIAGGPFVITAFDVADGGDRIIAAVATTTRPAELWDFSGGASRVLVPLNTDLLEELDLAEPEVISVPSTDGTEVEALLVRPPESVAGNSPGPGLIYIHGGPMSAYTRTFFDEFQMAAADGYTVIAGNPRGSDGYGEEWAQSITGALGQKDSDDIEALTNHLAGLETVDANRIGIGGGSYGGFMTSWTIGNTDRYQAALVERAVTNWESMAGTSDIGSWFLPMLLDADWHSGMDALRAISPMNVADNVTTPTLIIHSEEDWRCPIEQAEQFFAVLRRNGVDVTFARFPGENHELSRSGSPKHRVERLRIVHDFYASHLLDRSSRI